MEIDPVTPIYVQEKLRGIPDALNRLKGMSAPQQREICHRVQLEQIRACHAEKVAHLILYLLCRKAKARTLFPKVKHPRFRSLYIHFNFFSHSSGSMAETTEVSKSAVFRVII